MRPTSVRDHLAASSGLEDLELRAVRNRGLEIKIALECRRYVMYDLGVSFKIMTADDLYRSKLKCNML